MSIATKRPRTGQVVPLEGLMSSECLLISKKYYEDKYGRHLESMPPEMSVLPNYLEVTPLQMVEGIRRLRLREDRPDLFWLAKLYHLLPLPEHWIVRHKDMETKDFVYMRKYYFCVPPCFVYLYEQAQRLSNYPMVYAESVIGKRPAFGSYQMIYKDAEGNIQRVNIKALLEKVDAGEKLFEEQHKKRFGFRDWEKEKSHKSIIHRLIHQPIKRPEFLDTPRRAITAATKFEKGPEKDLGSYYHALRRGTDQWKHGKALMEEAVTNSAEVKLVNSKVDRRGYGFKMNPRLRATSKGVMRSTLVSALSQSRFNRTQSTFLHQLPSKNLTKYRVSKLQVTIGDDRTGKGFYLNRLVERENKPNGDQMIRVENQDYMPSYIDKSTLHQRVNRQIRGDHEEDEVEDQLTENPQDPFEQFEKEQQARQDPYKDEDYLEDGDTAYNDEEGPAQQIPIQTQSGFPTRTKGFRTTMMPRELPEYNEPSVQNLAFGPLTQSMENAHGPQFFKNGSATTTTFFEKRLNAAKSYNHFVQNVEEARNKIDPMQTLTKYNKPMYRSSTAATVTGLVKRAARDLTREYEELTVAKSRLGNSQSMYSLKNALLTPETTFYKDITGLPIPGVGSRLLTLENPDKKEKKKKPIKPKK